MGVRKLMEIGKRYNRLTVVDNVKLEIGRSRCLVQCECGSDVFEMESEVVRSGRTKSCGCLHDESSRINGLKNKRHGLTRTRVYNSWMCMRSRCYYKKDKDYKNYGERGITVCDRWLESLENFVEDMGDRPVDKTLDRMDVNLGYYKDNCRWATVKEQGRNRQNSLFFEYDGKRKTVNEWSDELGIKRVTLMSRRFKGWSVERIITTPLDKSKSRRRKK